MGKTSAESGVRVTRLAFGFVDILGVKAAIRRLGTKGVAELLLAPFVSASDYAMNWTSIAPRDESEFMAEARRRGFRPVPTPRLWSLQIADSLLVMAEPLETSDLSAHEALLEVDEHLGRVMRRCSMTGVYLRGAVSFGEFVVEVGGAPALLGESMLEAMQWEPVQDWSGAVYTASAQAVLFSEECEAACRSEWGVDLRSFMEATATSPCIYRDLPLKAAAPTLSPEPVVVNPTTHIGLREAFVAPDSMSGLPEDARRKLENTSRFAADLRGRQRDPPAWVRNRSEKSPRSMSRHSASLDR